jgi:hypothetical protein
LVKVLALVFALLLVALGTTCLVYPRTIQSVAVRSVSASEATINRAVRRFVSSDAYLWNVRAVGVGALLMASLLFVGLWRA